MQAPEEFSQVPLQIQGSLPTWLQGTLVRNGPVRVMIGGKTNAHWFDGLAELHAFAIDKGQVLYTNRFLRTEAYDAVFKNGTLNYMGFACDPCLSLFRRALTFFSPDIHALHNANINVGKIGDDYAALYEIPLPVRFDLSTLETLGVVDYADHLAKANCWESAHPHTGNETVNYLVEYGWQSNYVVYKIANGTTAREVIARVPVERPSYMHSFSLTPRYVILTEYPFVVRPLSMALKGKPFICNYEWKPERDTCFIVIDRSTGNVIDRMYAPPFFSFHHINAFEEGDHIVLDAVTYKDASIVEGIANHLLCLTNENDFPVSINRYILSSGTVHQTSISRQVMELPRINPYYDGKPYRFAYFADIRQPEGVQDQRPICKLDMSSGGKQEWASSRCYPGEPVFIPAPDGQREDEGLVATVVLNEIEGTSFLLFLDGVTFEEIARINVPHAIPAGLHGQFF